MDRLNLVREYSRKHSAKRPYHNYEHEVDVAVAAARIAHGEGVPDQDIELLQTAAYLHDIGYTLGEHEHELRGAQHAKSILPVLGYTRDESELVARLILATKWPTQPKDLLEQIICDSDIDSAGSEDFASRSEALRRELHYDPQEWRARQRGFLSIVKYYTATQRTYRDAGVQRNLKALEAE